MAVEKSRHGTWRARWRDPDGRQKARSFRRKVDAERFYREMMAARDRGAYIDPGAGRTTVAAAAADWLAGARNLAPSSLATYHRDLDRHILPVLGSVPLRSLTPERIDAWLNERAAAGTAPTSLLREYRTLHRLCAVAVERGRIGRNPVGLVTPPRVPPADMRFLTVAEVDAIANAITPRYSALVLVGAWGGLRWSEMVGLRRARTDGTSVRVVEQLLRTPGGEWYRQPPKTRAGIRTVTLPNSVATILGEHLDEWSAPGPDGLVFPNGRGSPLISSSWNQSVWQRALRKAGVGHVRPHDLRHTAVALAIAAGAHPKAIQARMGHASIGVTLDRYGHLFADIDSGVADGLERLRA